jgi:hypothetical protein
VSRTSHLLAMVALLTGFYSQHLTAQKTPDSAFSLVRQQIARDTDPLTRLMWGHALWRSGLWMIEGEYKGSTGVFYKATGYWTFALDVGLLATNKPNAVVALYLEPYGGGESHFWLGASLKCEIAISPTPPQPAHCLVKEGATALLDLNFAVDPGVFFRFQDVTVTLTEPEDKDPAKRWSARAVSRGHLHLVPVDSTSDWR